MPCFLLKFYSLIILISLKNTIKNPPKQILIIISAIRCSIICLRGFFFLYASKTYFFRIQRFMNAFFITPHLKSFFLNLALIQQEVLSCINFYNPVQYIFGCICMFWYWQIKSSISLLFFPFSDLLRFRCNAFCSIDRRTERLLSQSRGLPELW